MTELSSLWREHWVEFGICVALRKERHKKFTHLGTLLVPAHLAGAHHPQPSQQLTLTSIKQNGLVSFKKTK